MTDWITHIIESMGYAGIALLMFLENVFPPIPSELIMPLGGYSATQGELSFWGICIAGTVGSVLGQIPLYYLGRLWGEARLRRLADRHSKWLLVDSGDIDRASRWFSRYGGWSIFLARLVPGIRTLISIPAGMHKMNLFSFLLYSTVGMGLWATFLAWAGRLLGENYDEVGRYLSPISYGVFALLAIAAVWWMVQKKRKRG
ncbi:MAG: DedA family protein [Puniceicoccaceae bacterium 5H]|nr:MAG: DedA family protein [Puniceicoccaceae bacterium 5H]